MIIICIIAFLVLAVNIYLIARKIAKKKVDLPPQNAELSTCVSCGIPMPAHIAVCQYCGAVQAQADERKKCDVCGAVMFGADAYCGECGARLKRTGAELNMV